MNTPVLLQTDFYKTSHYKMYPEGTSKIYSNLTPRKSRLPGVNHIVVFGIQYFILEYLIRQWNSSFFHYLKTESEAVNEANKKIAKERVLSRYKRIMDATLGKDRVGLEHLEKLWDLQYLPLEIKALPEGTLCPIGVPCLTITNTVDHAYWLVNYLETILSCTIWQPITSATFAYEYKKLLNKFSIETTGTKEGVQFQGHDFSMRGMSSLESACTSGAGHLLSFVGTDTIPAISFLETYYKANVEKELVGCSVPATEHSVMCMGTKDDEIGTFERLIDMYPTGILSVVSDTWDLWKVCTEFLPKLKDKILRRDGKLVIRPDSGDPVDIICGKGFVDNEDGIFGGYYEWENGIVGKPKYIKEEEHKGVIELLWDIFGGTINEQGYKVLDPHIGAIYGDSITLERAEAICERLKTKGFASTNIVFGIGSYTYQMNTRDTFGFAIKATYGEIHHVIDDTLDAYQEKIEPREIFKNPITDDGTKKSKKGLLRVINREDLEVEDQQTKIGEKASILETVFLDGILTKEHSLSEIRERLNSFKY